MRIRFAKLITLFLTATLGVTTTAHAQFALTPQAGLLAFAKVVQPLSITPTRNLLFGTVFVGSTKTIAPADLGAAEFDIRGQSDAVVLVTLALPSSLQLNDDATIELPLSNWMYTTNLQPSPTSITSTNAQLSVTLPSSTEAAHLLLQLGATATASNTQATGDYTGQGELTVAYADF